MLKTNVVNMQNSSFPNYMSLLPMLLRIFASPGGIWKEYHNGSYCVSLPNFTFCAIVLVTQNQP